MSESLDIYQEVANNTGFTRDYVKQICYFLYFSPLSNELPEEERELIRFLTKTLTE